MPHFKMLDPRVPRAALGLIPEMLSQDCPLPATAQLDRGYNHAGGWKPFSGFTFDPKTQSLRYPGDPPMRPIAKATLRE